MLMYTAVTLTCTEPRKTTIDNRLPHSYHETLKALLHKRAGAYFNSKRPQVLILGQLFITIVSLNNTWRSISLIDFLIGVNIREWKKRAVSTRKPSRTWFVWQKINNRTITLPRLIITKKAFRKFDGGIAYQQFKGIKFEQKIMLL